MVDYPEPQRDALGVEANPVAPYWLFHATAVPFTAVVDPYTAARLTLALYLGLTPLAFGFWLAARGARPLHGAYSVLLVFGAMPAWGFVGLVAGLPALAVLLGLAERLAASPRRHEAVAIALVVLLLYYAHAFVWLAGVIALGFVLVRRGVPRALLAIPVLGVLLSTVLLITYRITFQATPYMEALDAQVTSPLEPSLTRATSLVLDSAAYGLTDLASPFAYATWGTLAIQLGLAGRARAAWTHRELRYAMAAGGALLCCVLASPRAYLLPLRFSVLATTFLIATLPVVTSRASRLALGLGCAFAFASTAVAAFSGLDFTRRTECVETVIVEMRDPGRTLTLVGRTPLEGYAQPVLDHMGLLVAARRGGVPFHETFHTGAHPLRARDPGRLPDRDTMLLHALPMLYTPDRARDYDTILTIPVIDPVAILGDELGAFDALRCGRNLVLQRVAGAARDSTPTPMAP